MPKSVSIGTFDLPLDVKNIDDVLKSIDFDSDEQRIVCEDIVKSLEKDAANYIRNDRKVMIPFMGVFSADRYNATLSLKSKEIKEIKRTKGIDAANQFRYNLIFNMKSIIDNEDEEEKSLAKVRKNNDAFYKKYGMMYGAEAARAMMRCIMRLTPVEFNEEIEEQLQLIYNEE